MPWQHIGYISRCPIFWQLDELQPLWEMIKLLLEHWTLLNMMK